MTGPRLQTVAFEDLHVGLSEVMSRIVAEDDIESFAALSGDRNPVHLCDTYASGTRFGSRIAHGLYTASLISAVIGTRLPGPGSIYLSQSLRFHAPVRIGDRVDVRLEVIALAEKGRRCTLKCECRVGEAIVLDGEALVSAPPRTEAIV